MGYYSTAQGEVTITPPLALQSHQFEEEGMLVLREYEPFLLVDGNLTLPEDEFRAYDLEEVATRLMQDFPGHTFFGSFSIQGESPDDYWELEWKGRSLFKWGYERVRQEKPTQLL